MKVGMCDLDQTAKHLAGLIRQSLQRGHTRVALQRTFMLHRLCGCVPADLAQVIDSGARRLSTREICRMQRAASEWVSMLRARPW